jgi:hypothetical protein
MNAYVMQAGPQGDDRVRSIDVDRCFYADGVAGSIG